jgi:hypothetical protein
MSSVPSPKKYLLDTNAFIQSQNFCYRFEFCQGFWDWIIQAHLEKIVFSINKVKKELDRGRDNDPVRLWMANDLFANFFLPDIQDQQVMANYKQLMQRIATDTHYTQQAKDEFMRAEVADAFLIAVAKSYDYGIVTHEKRDSNSKKRVIIPNIAAEYHIECIMLHDLLCRYAQDNFSLRS